MNNEISTILVDETTGVHYRQETTDIKIIREIPKHYGNLVYSGQVVLDIGAQIGSFSRFALSLGAEKVIAIEPQRGNFEMLIQNQIAGKMICMNYAVVGDDTLRGTLYVNPGDNKGMHSLIKRANYVEESVECINFYYLLETYRPTILKIDIEGGEYELFDQMKLLPAHIQQIAMEFHFVEHSWRENKARKLIKYFIKQNGFNFITVPSTTTKTSKSVGTFTRT